jgi:hypothetical protein
MAPGTEFNTAEFDVTERSSRMSCFNTAEFDVTEGVRVLIGEGVAPSTYRLTTSTSTATFHTPIRFARATRTDDIYFNDPE